MLICDPPPADLTSLHASLSAFLRVREQGTGGYKASSVLKPVPRRWAERTPAVGGPHTHELLSACSAEFHIFHFVIVFNFTKQTQLSEAPGHVSACWTHCGLISRCFTVPGGLRTCVYFILCFVTFLCFFSSPPQRQSVPWKFIVLLDKSVLDLFYRDSQFLLFKIRKC